MTFDPCHGPLSDLRFHYFYDLQANATDPFLTSLLSMLASVVRWLASETDQNLTSFYDLWTMPRTMFRRHFWLLEWPSTHATDHFETSLLTTFLWPSTDAPDHFHTLRFTTVSLATRSGSAFIFVSALLCFCCVLVWVFACCCSLLRLLAFWGLACFLASLCADASVIFLGRPVTCAVLDAAFP